MGAFQFHKSLTAFLSCSVLASALMPPALCHSHADGDRHHSHKTHEHQHADSHHHTRDAGHGHSSPDHHETAAIESKRFSEETSVSPAHIHLTILGLAFSLPSPRGQGSKAPFLPFDSSGDDFEVVRLTDDTLTLSPVDLNSAVDVSIAYFLTVDDASESGIEFAQQTRDGAACRVRLCDVARLERSGVLLT